MLVEFVQNATTTRFIVKPVIIYTPTQGEDTILASGGGGLFLGEL